MDLMYIGLGVCLGGCVATFLIACNIERKANQAHELIDKVIDLQERLVRCSTQISQRQSEQWLEAERRLRNLEKKNELD